jgi:hypothetical protein
MNPIAMNPMPMPKATRRSRPVEYFMLQEPHGEGPQVGTFAGQAISERMTDYLGERYRFAGIAPRLQDGRYDVDALRTGEWLVEPGLIYARETRGRLK